MVVVGHKAHEVYRPHGADEAYGTEHANRRKVFYRVHAGVDQAGESNGIAQSDGRHIESHAQRVEREQRGHFYVCARRHAVIGRRAHKQAGQEVANAQKPLRRYPAVGHNAHKSGHENRDETLNGIEPADMLGQAHVAEIAPHRG